MTAAASSPRIVCDNPYAYETRDYRVLPQASQVISPGKSVYAVINKVTGVIEAEGFQLPLVIVTCVAFQQSLDDVRSGEAFKPQEINPFEALGDLVRASGKPN
jgi:hypothetical protein